jgi:RND family efflux transporter MFP subunit
MSADVLSPDSPRWRALGRWAGLALLVLVTGCGRHGKEAPVGGSAAPPAQARIRRGVELTQVKQEKLSSYVDTVGYLEAEGQVDIAAGVSGVVDRILFREGQWVDGDKTVLVEVDQEYYLQSLQQARDNESRARATLNLNQLLKANADVAGTGTSVEERQKLAGNIQISQADLSAATAARKLAEHKLHRSRVVAPYTGQINQRRVAKGTYIEEKTVIATMADLSRLRLVGYVPERSAPLVRQMLADEESRRTGFLVGSWMATPWSGLVSQAIEDVGATPARYRLEFELRPFPNQKFFGRIFYLSTVASPDTHMFECKAEVPLSGLSAELRPGYSAKIRCPLPGNEKSLVVPEECMRSSERGWIVFRPRPETDDHGKRQVDDQGRLLWVAEAVTVEPGIRQPGTVEVTQASAARSEGSDKLRPGKVEVLKNLNLADWIVRRGAEALEDGTPIVFDNKTAEELEAAVKAADAEAAHKAEPK